MTTAVAHLARPIYNGVQDRHVARQRPSKEANRNGRTVTHWYSVGRGRAVRVVATTISSRPAVHRPRIPIPKGGGFCRAPTGHGRCLAVRLIGVGYGPGKDGSTTRQRHGGPMQAKISGLSQIMRSVMPGGFVSQRAAN